MTKRLLLALFTLTTITSAVALALSVPATFEERFDGNRGGDDDDRHHNRPGHDDDHRRRDDNDRKPHGGVRLATGQFVTPPTIEDATQLYLNPQLPAYPNFIAGEAVRSRLSPDGTTLAVLTAGQNSLYRPDGTVDPANSTQYIFLYDVTNRSRPSLKQVIKQLNAHVGLVFSPDGNTLYAAGGNDD